MVQASSGSPPSAPAPAGFWEHRFFGSAYNLDISHRLPRVALSAGFSRDLSNYPQLAFAIPAGASVASYIDAAFTTRIPDPTERARAVQEFLSRSGLSGTLFAPVNFFSTTFLEQTTERVSAVLLGVRNSITLTLFRVRSSTLTGQDSVLGSVFPGAFQFNQNNTQIGAGVGFSHVVSAITNFNINGSVSRVTADSSSAEDAVDRAINANLTASVGTQLGARTTGSVGASYSRFLPQGGTNAHGASALNIFAAVSHVFR